MNSFTNIVSNAFRPGYAAEMARKLGRRLGHLRRADTRAIASWCSTNATDIDGWARSIDASLWRESTKFADAQRAYAQRQLSELAIDLGGGGAYDLLYFLTRLLRPSTVVESGVAAGFSSRAFLLALRKNGRGRLYSSDFPYFRIERPERFVGYLVEPELRSEWELHVLGDHKNFPKIAAAIDHVDLLHYDSDKSYAGRAHALKALAPFIDSDSVILFDDIQDNWHFRDCVQSRREWRVFPFEGKWLGMWGGPSLLYAPGSE